MGNKTETRRVLSDNSIELLTYHSNGQVAIYKKYKDYKTQIYTTWYCNGQICDEILYLNWERNGVYCKWFSNGKPKIQATYINGKLQGEYRHWNSSGNIIELSIYKDDKLHGKCSYIIDNMISEVEYQDGQLQGIHSIFYPNRKLLSTTLYHNNKRNGEYREWYVNGSLKVLSFYINDILHGEYKSWHSNGQLQSQLYYTDKIDLNEMSYKKLPDGSRVYCRINVKHGVCIEWYDNGQMKIQCVYQEGKLTDEYLEWHENGTIKQQAMYRDGKLHGKFYTWNNNKTPLIMATYNNGKIEGICEYGYWNSSHLWTYLNGRLITSREHLVLTQLVNNIRYKIQIAKLFGLSLPRFKRCIQSLKSRAFCEWWYNPDAPGGRRTRRLLGEWVNQTIVK